MDGGLLRQVISLGHPSQAASRVSGQGRRNLLDALQGHGGTLRGYHHLQSVRQQLREALQDRSVDKGDWRRLPELANSLEQPSVKACSEGALQALHRSSGNKRSPRGREHLPRLRGIRQRRQESAEREVRKAGG